MGEICTVCKTVIGARCDILRCVYYARRIVCTCLATGLGLKLNMRKRTVFFSGAFLCVTWAATASPIIYQVTVNTSSISNTAGSFDFNFNPGSLGCPSRRPSRS